MTPQVSESQHRLDPFLLDDRQTRKLEKPRVLVIEHELETRLLLRLALRSDGCEVVESRDAQDALDYLMTTRLNPEQYPPPNLVVLDLRVSGYGGLQVLADIRTVTPYLPVIAVGTEGDHELKIRAERLAAHAVLDDPEDLEGLRGALFQVLST